MELGSGLELQGFDLVNRAWCSRTKLFKCVERIARGNESPMWPVVNSATGHRGLLLGFVADTCRIAAARASNNMEACPQP